MSMHPVISCFTINKENRLPLSNDFSFLACPGQGGQMNLWGTPTVNRELDNHRLRTSQCQATVGS